MIDHIDRARAEALDYILGIKPSTPSLRALAWRIIRRWGVA